jgi:hypothetical protein
VSKTKRRTFDRIVAEQEAAKIAKDLEKYGRAFYLDGHRVDPRRVMPVHPRLR